MTRRPSGREHEAQNPEIPELPFQLTVRPRRNRRCDALRRMVRETHITPADLI